MGAPGWPEFAFEVASICGGGRRIVSEMLSSAQFDNGTVPSFEAEKLVETYGEHPDGVNSKLVQITESHGGRCFCGD
jgi:hypothetical protein